jgi:putative transcriptional regulator
MIAYKFKDRLRERCMNQLTFSKETGIRYNTVNDLYHELAISVKLEHLDKICEELDCDLSDLIEYIPKKKK